MSCAAIGRGAGDDAEAAARTAGTLLTAPHRPSVSLCRIEDPDSGPVFGQTHRIGHVLDTRSRKMAFDATQHAAPFDNSSGPQTILLRKSGVVKAAKRRPNRIRSPKYKPILKRDAGVWNFVLGAPRVRHPGNGYAGPAPKIADRAPGLPRPE